MEQAMPERLSRALELLCYDSTKELHHRSNLIYAIGMFAGAICDKEIEDACLHELEEIQKLASNNNQGKSIEESAKRKPEVKKLSISKTIIIKD